MPSEEGLPSWGWFGDPRLYVKTTTPVHLTFALIATVRHCTDVALSPDTLYLCIKGYTTHHVTECLSWSMKS